MFLLKRKKWYKDYYPCISHIHVTCSVSVSTHKTKSCNIISMKSWLPSCWRLNEERCIWKHGKIQETIMKMLQSFCVGPPSSLIYSPSHVSFALLAPQIPYLGFCSCEEQGDTGVWQLADPPILPLTHGPNHSFDWRETLLQEWRPEQTLLTWWCTHSDCSGTAVPPPPFLQILELSARQQRAPRLSAPGDNVWQRVFAQH